MARSPKGLISLGPEHSPASSYLPGSIAETRQEIEAVLEHWRQWATARIKQNPAARDVLTRVANIRHYVSHGAPVEATYQALLGWSAMYQLTITDNEKAIADRLASLEGSRKRDPIKKKDKAERRAFEDGKMTDECLRLKQEARKSDQAARESDSAIKAKVGKKLFGLGRSQSIERINKELRRRGLNSKGAPLGKKP